MTNDLSLAPAATALVEAYSGTLVPRVIAAAGD